MMANWRRWIRPGLVATLVLALAAVIFRSDAVERDLAERAAAKLAAGGHGWAEVDVSGRNVTIRGWRPTRSLTELATAQSAIRRQRSIKHSLT